MTVWVYIQSELACDDLSKTGLWTVGFYDPQGNFHPDNDYPSKEEAAWRVHWLNGGKAWIDSEEQR